MPEIDKRKQLEIENTWRKKILAEPDPATRFPLYAQAYDELMRFFTEGMPEKQSFGYVESSLLPSIRAICKGRDVVDYGCGYGLAAMDMARAGARSVIGFEVSEIMRNKATQEAARRSIQNIEFRPVQQGRMNLPPESRDLIFCYDVCEHLHPDDLRDHLLEAYKTLRRRGYYYCETTLRRFGPNDISGEFLPRGSEPQGLHLKEYTFKEIQEAFQNAGFRHLKTPWISSRFLRKSPWRPLGLTIAMEKTFLGRSGFATGVLGMDSIYLLAQK